MTDVNLLCMGCMNMRSDVGVCPRCGFDEAAHAPSPHHLPARIILAGKYLLGRVLGEGGFGITYIGWDLNLDLKVAIKEYYPTGFVTRESTSTRTVIPYTGEQGEFFIKGRERFVEEAKSLAKFRSMPGIVTVNDFFAENGTAYIVMEYIDGLTFKAYLSNMGGSIPADQVFFMMHPIMTSLAMVHKSGMVHRDISPDNIMISKEGYVKLLDFGAARDFIDSGNKSLSVMLKPGYAPEEQYRSRGIQGPWTDVYALCATMYRAITGVAPDESTERLVEDVVKRPSELNIAIDAAKEAALMKGIAILQKNRFQSIAELLEPLYPESGMGVAVPVETSTASVETAGSVETAAPTNSNQTAAIETADAPIVKPDNRANGEKNALRRFIRTRGGKAALSGVAAVAIFLCIALPLLNNSSADIVTNTDGLWYTTPTPAPMGSDSAAGRADAPNTPRGTADSGGAATAGKNTPTGGATPPGNAPSDKTTPTAAPATPAHMSASAPTAAANAPRVTTTSTPSSTQSSAPTSTPFAATKSTTAPASTTPKSTPTQAAAATSKPAATPTRQPTAAPTQKPTTAPTAQPTAQSTAAPTQKPTAAPTAQPTAAPTQKPTAAPTAQPTAAPTAQPTAAPTAQPTSTPASESYSCSKCGAKFSTSGDLTVHQLQNHVVIEYTKCDKCGGNFGAGKNHSCFLAGETCSVCGKYVEKGTHIHT